MSDILILVTAIASVANAIILVLVLLKIGPATGKIAGTSMTAKELAQELGGSIESAFKNYVPQPEKLAAAVTGAVEQSVKKASEGVDALHKNMVASQTQTAEKWAAHEKGTVASLEAAKKALDESAGKLGSALSGATDKLQAALTGHAQQLEKAESAGRDQLKSLLTQHADSLQKASQAIAGQLDKIMALEKDIQQVLHVQQVVDGTLKSVTTTDEFKQTLAALRKHLESSDGLLKEVAKPRTIRLVESET